MLDPVGPLAPSVYWRRRALAFGALAAALLTGVWSFGALLGGDETVAFEAAGVRSSTGPVRSSNPPSELAPPGASSSSAAPSSASPAPESPPAPPPPPPPPPPPQPCPDQVVAVAAEVSQPEYRVGQRPDFNLVVTNAGQLACTRDLDSGLQEMVVTSADGQTRLWSSNDCYPSQESDVRLLAPGERVAFRVAWAGRTSAPGCSLRRKPVLAGDYLVLAKLGPLSGPPVPFRLV